MSDEQRNDEEAEVEGHRRRFAGNDEATDEAGGEDEDNEVEAHKRHMNNRLDSLRKD